MYSATQSYLFTSFAPKDVQKNVLDIREKLGVLPYVGGSAEDDIITKNFPHVTLKASFFLKDELTESELLKLVDTISFSPIPVVGKKYEIYDTKELGNIIVIVIEKNPELQKLHNDIIGLLKEKIVNADPNFKWEQNMYTPHMSIIYDVEEQKKEMATSLVDNLLPISFTLNNLYFLGKTLGVRHTRKVLKKIYAKN